ncbi:hypothetical protein RCC89_11600 [Cytophagaceae bacterium ABcell3]|nr:hypothetical protein RCC89_11600 [Cytophagaceae bacterium ABcell3]
MKNIILYTKKFPLVFDDNAVCQIDISKMVEELSQDYNLLEKNPSITVVGDFQYVSFALSKKEDRQKIGF